MDDASQKMCMSYFLSQPGGVSTATYPIKHMEAVAERTGATVLTLLMVVGETYIKPHIVLRGADITCQIRVYQCLIEVKD